MYSISGYGAMIADRVRMDAHLRALRQSVKPGSVVLDIGTGTGIFSLLACQLGARRVYAVEPSDAIELAREIAAANGYAETIEFIQALSTEIALPERADVIISDLRGVLPFHGRHLLAIADARRRFLAPGGVLIPQRDTLWVACVEASDSYGGIATPWSGTEFGLDMRAGLKLVTNQWRRIAAKPEHLLAAAQCCGTLEYATLAGADFSTIASFVAARAGRAGGHCLWFDAKLAEGVELSNAPGAAELIYGNAFFPWSDPVDLEAGDTVTLDMKARLVADSYIWSWNTLVLGQGDRGQIKADLKQSDFFGTPWSPAKLRKQAAGHVATLNEDGIIDQMSLELMREGQPLGDIARQLAARFPQRFARWQDALTHVGALSARYSR